MPTSKLTRVRVEDLVKDERPLLAARTCGEAGRFFELGTEVDERLDLAAGEGFDGKEMVHG
jgi:hypothetical protein